MEMYAANLVCFGGDKVEGGTLLMNSKGWIKNNVWKKEYVGVRWRGEESLGNSLS